MRPITEEMPSNITFASDTLGNAMANPTTLLVGAMVLGWDGNTWERVILTNGTADGLGTVLTGLISQCYLYGFNGSSWDRLRSDSSHHLLVNVADGAVGGYTTVISQSPTLQTASAYGAGTCLGSLLTLASAVRVNNGTGVIQSITVADKAQKNDPLDVILFSSNPNSSTFTDNSQPVIATADLLNVIGVVSVGAGDYAAFNTGANGRSVATKNAIGLPFKTAVSSQSIYAVLVNRGSPQYASSSDLQLTVTVFQD